MKLMNKLNPSHITELFDNFKDKYIAVIGDLMLDSYMWGTVQRISPEAPVPVVEVTSEQVKLGGAANVANNILNLGAKPIPLGIVGEDISGEHIRRLFSELGIESEGIISDVNRPTTVKTRIIAHDQHVVRADVESKDNITFEIEDRLLEKFREWMPLISGVILQDYNKGVLTPRVIRDTIALCREREVFVAVDPKFNNFFEYKSVDLLKPNVRETELALGMKITSDDDLSLAAQTLFERLECRNIMITRGAKGMSLFSDSGKALIVLPTLARKIHDVSGAGDTVISTFVVARVAGADLIEAMTLANHAAAIVCGEVGVVPIEKEALWESVMHMLS